MKDYKVEIGQNNDHTGSIFIELLTVAFIVLKLTNVIDWKWVWVFAPIWVSIALVTLLTVITMIIMGVDKLRRKKL